MASPTQFLANIANAQRSTGPNTPAGKSAASKNSQSHGLFSRVDFAETVRTPDFLAVRAEVPAKVNPVGAIQESLADQLARAIFRLRRIDQVEDGLIESLLHPDADLAQLGKLQASIDRARTQYQRLQLRAISELRKLQTISTYQVEVALDPAADLADMPKIHEAASRCAACAKRTQSPHGLAFADPTGYDAMVAAMVNLSTEERQRMCKAA